MINIIGLIVSLLVLTLNVIILNLIRNLRIKDLPEKMEYNPRRSQLLNEIVEFTVNSGYECMIIPDREGNNTLFIRREIIIEGRTQEEMIPVISIPSQEINKNLPEYDFILNQAKEELRKIKEEQNVKN